MYNESALETPKEGADASVQRNPIRTEISALRAIHHV
eukprot:XP_001707947.1 Hypothetical protein GL50803_35686 [Giardia lamblia ATCC 50803]